MKHSAVTEVRIGEFLVYKNISVSGNVRDMVIPVYHESQKCLCHGLGSISGQNVERNLNQSTILLENK